MGGAPVGHPGGPPPGGRPLVAHRLRGSDLHQLRRHQGPVALASGAGAVARRGRSSRRCRRWCTRRSPIAGWDARSGFTGGPGAGPIDLRRSSWHSRFDFAASGQYQMSASDPAGTLVAACTATRVGSTHAPLGPEDCERRRRCRPASFGLGHRRHRRELRRLPRADGRAARGGRLRGLLSRATAPAWPTISRAARRSRRRWCWPPG